MTTTTIPSRADVVVIGGGPAGSSVANLLARAGYETLLLEKARHPRPTVGESLIPHFWKFAEALGVTAKVDAERFVTKAGGIVVWDGKIRQIRFDRFGYVQRAALHVERDRFDHLLLRHAESVGAQVHEEVTVRRVDLSRGDAPVVHYEDRRGGSSAEGSVVARYVVDASGISGVIAGQANARRRVSADGKYLGMWGYFKNARFLGADREVYEANQVYQARPVTFVLSYKDGWAWHIILRDTTSIGLVINTDATKGMNKKAQEEYFLRTVTGIPYLRDLLAGATYVPDSLFFRPDYSYYSENVVGDGYFCIGDAASFVDPIFSQGVTTGMYNATVCTWAIDQAMKKPAREPFFREMFRRRLLEYYGFSRLLAFGDFGGEGIDAAGVRNFILSMPPNELGLALTAAATTNRSDNLRRMVREAGLNPETDDEFISDKSESLSALKIVEPVSRAG